MHLILSIFLGIASFFGIMHRPTVPTQPKSGIIKIAITPSPIPQASILQITASPSALPTISNPYKDQLIANLKEQISSIDTEIQKWNEALQFNQAAEKQISQSLDDAMKGNNGVNASAADLYNSSGIEKFAAKIQQDRDEIDKLNYEKTQLLIELANEAN